MPKLKGKGLEKMVTGASPDALNLISMMLKFDPKKRPKIDEILKHSYFTKHTIPTPVLNHLRLGAADGLPRKNRA